MMSILLLQRMGKRRMAVKWASIFSIICSTK